MTKQEFINLIAPAAVEAYKKYNILPSLTLAQAALESNWGNSAPGCMLFGIKWTSGCGYDWQLLKTTEYYSKGEFEKLKASGAWYELLGIVRGLYHVRVKAKFRRYNSYAESIEDHAELLLKPRYAKVRAAKDYKEACQVIYQAGYATDPKYPDKLIKLIEDYNLNKWGGEDEDEMIRYQRLADIPESFRATIEALMDAGIIVGDGSDPVGHDDVIDLSHDQVRILVFLYRAGVFSKQK